MRIGFDAKRAFNNSTGLGNYSRNLVNALGQYFPRNDYLLFTPKMLDGFLQRLRWPVTVFLPEFTLFPPLWRSFGITRQLEKQGIEIYHGLSNELPFNIHRSGIKSVVTIHDLIFLKHKEQYPFFDRQMYEWKTRYAAKHADKIIAVSNETKNDLMKFYRVPEEKIEVVYQSIDESFYSAIGNQPAAPAGGQSAIIQKYGLTKKYILNVGSFFPRKNQKTLIEAFALIKDKIEEDLVLVGSQGNLKNEIEQLVHQKNIEGRVKILSQVANEDLPVIYRSASVFVFPSLYEGFGIPIVEALAGKIPVITTKGGCFEEAGGKDSLYVNPLNAGELANAILKVLSDTTLRNKMIESGYPHALTFSNKAFAEKTMAVYNELPGK